MKEIQLSQSKIAIVDDEDFNHLLSCGRWSITDNGYAFNSKLKFMHRYLFKMHNKNIDGKLIDHINGNKLDNRKDNLRECSNSENLHNSKPPKTNTSGYKGVRWCKKSNRWTAAIQINYKTISLGSFEHKRDAAIAYDIISKIYFDFRLIDLEYIGPVLQLGHLRLQL